MQSIPGFFAFPILLAAVCAVAGCATLSGPTLADWEKQDLKVVRLVLDGNPVPVPAQPPITLNLSDDGKVSGRSTVNRYFGGFTRTQDGGVVWTGALGATRMAGSPEAMKTEAEYFQALTLTSEIKVSQDLLIFQSPDQKNVVELKRL